MEITKLSTKGQIVIPEKLRSDLEVGEAFVVIKKENLLVLRKIEGLSKTEIQELEELQKIWNEIDKGNCKTSVRADLDFILKCILRPGIDTLFNFKSFKGHDFIIRLRENG